MKYRRLVREFTFLLVAIAALVSVSRNSAQAEHEGKVQVLLLGDSTTIGSVCRRSEPKGPHLEDVIRNLLAAESEHSLSKRGYVGERYEIGSILFL